MTDKDLEHFMKYKQPWTSFLSNGFLEMDKVSGGVRIRDQFGNEPNIEELDKLLKAMKQHRDTKVKDSLLQR
ncbi:hypothetical protein [Priestia megaterium]